VIFGPSFDDVVFFPASTVVLEIFLGMVLHGLFSWLPRGDFPHNYPNCYILDDGVSYARLPRCVDKAIRLLFPEILMSVLLPLLLDQFNGCSRARALVLRLKIMEEPSLIFTYL
jgi:hypothetical protein